MKKFYLLIGMGLLSCLVACQTTVKKHTTLRPGETEVVLAKGAFDTTAFAAEEATNFLSQVLGAAVPIVERPTPGKTSLILGTNEWCAAAGLSTEGFARDEFRIHRDAGCVYIFGQDRNERIFDRLKGGWDGPNVHLRCGTLFGVYEFLERFAGVRFYFPSEMGTVVPRKESIDVTEDVSMKPDFIVRDCLITRAGVWPQEVSKKEDGRLRLLYKLRLRECSQRPQCCHGQNHFKIPERFSDSHPEYFMLRKDGTRCTGTVFKHHWQGRQLCHTSPVWDIFREETLEKIRKGARSVDLMPQDGMQPCQCATCQARFNTTNFSLSSAYATDLIWSNTVAVANAITAAGLKGEVAQMAYGTYREPPKFEIPENVNVVLAVGGPWSEAYPDIQDKQVEFVRGWAQKLGRKIAWLWTYPMKNTWRLQAPDVPQHAPHAYLSFYRRVAPYIKGAFVESNGKELHIIHNYLNFYVFSKFAWDHSFDLDTALAEHHRLMFGAGADDMAKFFDLLERRWIDDVAIPSVIGETDVGPEVKAPSKTDLWTKIYTPKFLAQLRGYLDRAARKVQKDSMEARRIAWIRTYFYEPLAARAADFMQKQLKKGKGGKNPSMEGVRKC